MDDNCKKIVNNICGGARIPVSNSLIEVHKIGEEYEVPVIRFPNLAEVPRVRHGSSTRLGGVSGQACESAHLASMNMSVKCGDTEERVHTNFRLFCKACGVPFESITFSQQTHTANIRVVTTADRGKGLTCERDYCDIDGMITDVSGIGLTVFSADCVPVLFAQRDGTAIGAAHCGWRGTYSGLQVKMVEKFNELYGIDPSELVVAIGPAIHSECYEVDRELYEKFSALHLGSKTNEANVENAGQYENAGKYYLDLPTINKLLLARAGVPEKNIFVSDLCTACHPDFLFSHRASHGKRGLQVSCIYKD